MSPIEVFREIEASKLRQHDQLNQQIHLAWRIEQIRLATKQTKAGKKTTVKIVDLKKVLMPEPTAKRRQTVQEMRGALAMLSATYGIPLRHHGHD